uniref:Uncharacterized protein n=1 Tax=Romanomermis culicivorax TaxID=13658 RepID=A0A915J676_ROMCU
MTFLATPWALRNTLERAKMKQPAFPLLPVSSYYNLHIVPASAACSINLHIRLWSPLHCQLLISRSKTETLEFLEYYKIDHCYRIRNGNLRKYRVLSEVPSLYTKKCPNFHSFFSEPKSKFCPAATFFDASVNVFRRRSIFFQRFLYHIFHISSVT